MYITIEYKQGIEREREGRGRETERERKDWKLMYDISVKMNNSRICSGFTMSDPISWHRKKRDKHQSNGTIDWCIKHFLSSSVFQSQKPQIMGGWVRRRKKEQQHHSTFASYFPIRRLRSTIINGFLIGIYYYANLL